MEYASLPDLFIEGAAFVARTNGCTWVQAYETVCELNMCNPDFAPMRFKIAVQRAFSGN